MIKVSMPVVQCDQTTGGPLLNYIVHKREGKTRGFYDYRSNGPLLAAVWFDRRFISFLSPLHRAECSTPCSDSKENELGW